MREITEKQKSVLGQIEKFISKNGYPPSIRELAKMNKVSVKSIQDIITALVKKEYLSRQPGQARTLAVLKSAK